MASRKLRGTVLCSCIICKKEMTTAGIHTHVKRTHENSMSSTGNTGKKGKNQYIKSRELGLLMPSMSKEGRAQIGKNQEWGEEKRKKHSEKMLMAVLENPESYSFNNVCRRTKREYYNGEYFHSPWEIIVAKFLDKNKIRWTRKVKPIEYFFEDKKHYYFPDFYLIEYDKLIEVKGYTVDKDYAKWKAAGDKLIVIRGKEIDQIQQDSFVLDLR